MLEAEKKSNIDSSRGDALVIRMGAYDITQAVPRAASTLKEMGYNVTILALDRYGDKPDSQTINDWQVLWYHHSYIPGNKLSFLWTGICWWFWVLRRLRDKKYKLVQASNLESIVPCAIARRFMNFALVFDVRDPWGMTGSNPRSWLIRIFKATERWCARHVDGIVLSQGILDRTGTYFGPKVCAKVPVVQVLNVPECDFGQKYRPPYLDKIRINFSGHISYVRNAQAVMDLMMKNANTIVDVVGEIRDKKLYDNLKSISNINLYGQVPFKKAMELLEQANIISIMYDTNTEVAIVSSANKMFEAMMMSRPYIASKNSFPGIIAEQYGLGWVVPYGDSEALINLASELLAHPEKIEAAAQKGRYVYMDKFTWDRQKANLILMYRFVTKNVECKLFQHAGWSKMLGTVL